ncbi:MAG: MBL fold metallo-hydrolase [Acidobacteriota bacterium]|nr:MBL fold metallo-hydrolase [Acidobacteriota bacterium]
MKVTFLGTGTSVGVPAVTCDCDVCTSDDPRDNRLRPSVLIEWDGASVLIDTSTDLRAQALRHPIQRIDAVLYTHHHADHILGIDDLRIYNWRRGGPIPIYGSAATLDRIARTFWYVFEEKDTPHTRPTLEPMEISGPFSLLGRTIHPVPVLHGDLEILGYRVGRFAYLTDVSAIPESSARLLEDLDVLVLSALRTRPHPTHLSLDQAVAEAEKIGAARSLFTHLSHDIPHGSVSATLPEGVELAYDGLQLHLEEGEA